MNEVVAHSSDRLSAAEQALAAAPLGRLRREQ